MDFRIPTFATSFAIALRIILSVFLFVICLEVASFCWVKFQPPSKNLDIRSGPTGERKLFCRYDPLLGYDGISFAKGEFKGVSIAQNSYGDRGLEPSNGELKKIKLGVFGDSQVWGWGLPQDATIPALLSNHLSERYQIYNLGVSGYGPDQSYLKYLLRREVYEVTDVVFILFLSNDLSEMESAHAWGVNKPYFKKEKTKLCVYNYPVSRQLGWPEFKLGENLLEKFPVLRAEFVLGPTTFSFRKSNFFKLLNSREWTKNFSTNFESVNKSIQIPCTQNAQSFSKFELFEEIMQRWRSDVISQRGTFYVYIVPDKNTYMRGLFSQDEAMVSKVLQKLQIPFTRLPQLTTDTNASNYRRDPTDLHLSEQGSKIVAHQIADYFQARN